MVKRRPGFDRRPAAARPPARRPTGASTTAAAVRRRNTALFATVGGGIGIVIFALVGGLGSPGASAGPSSEPPTATSTSTSTAAATATPTAAASDEPTPTIGGSGPVISGVACDVDEKTAYHVHSHLNIRFDGELQVVPADIGITNTCLYWLHTHAASGILHVEAPAEAIFTLGQFFDVWGQPLGPTQVVGRTVGAGESLFVFVDRERVEVDPRTIELGDLVAIELQVGTEALEPLPYTFPAEFE
ncbi:MAG: hypothetical protein AB1736_05370 [Chloroflexota bacterium]